ncbi:MAG: SDR family NAD(P)-dependent oxidoreductase [Burkholderiaceae bacterium]
MKVDLSGRVAIVTGAFSGLGLHFSKVLASQGARVAMLGRRVELGRTLAGEINASLARADAATAIGVDVRSATSVSTALQQIVATLGVPDVLINNAGIALRSPALETPEADWMEMLDVNLSGVMRMAQATAREMVRAGRPGSIVVVQPPAEGAARSGSAGT